MIQRLEKFWCGASVKEAARVCLAEYKTEADACMKQADRICENTFLFQEHWEMERTFCPLTFYEEIKWDAVPFGDPEWTYALNRHTCFLILGKAWQYTKNLKYGEKFAALAEDWICNAPLTQESRSNTWRSLEAGIRVEFWLKSLLLFEDCPAVTEELREKMEDTLRLHADYLLGVNESFHHLSNWGVLQNHGLFLLGLYFGEEEWRKEALRRLDEEAYLQVFRDGSQWEQSPMYHAEVLYGLLDSLLHARRFGVSVPKRLEEKIHKMVYAMAAWCKPDGHMPCQSDSDDIDARDLIAQGALLFKDSTLKFLAHGILLEDNIWNFTKQEREAYESIPSVKPEKASVALTDSGNYFLKSGLTKDADYLRFHCGCMGSGHGHGDQLHVDYFSCGEDILVDPGRYTYVYNEERERLKLPSAHNTVCVDGEEFCACADSWGYTKMALPIKGEYCFLDKMGMVSGAHLGYADKGILPLRRAILLEKGLVVLCDSFYRLGKEKGGHRYTSFFHFSNRGTVSEAPGGARYQSEGVQARLLCLKGENRLKKAELSPVYNLLEEGVCLENELVSDGAESLPDKAGVDAVQFTVLAAEEVGKELVLEAELLPVSMVRSGRTLEAQEAQAVRIKKNGREFVVIVVLQELISEVDYFTAGGYCSYGKVMAFTPSCKEGVVLQY